MPRLFTGGLPSDLKEETLEKLFTPFGKVVQVDIKRINGKGIGFGFVEMEDAAAAEQAVWALDDTFLEEQTKLMVHIVAEPPILLNLPSTSHNIPLL